MYEMPANVVVELLTVLNEHEVRACVGGGWGVDALLGEQTRPHSDLDLWLPATDLEGLFVAMAGQGMDRILPWPGDRPWNFVLHDGQRLRIDLHLYERLSDGDLHYGSVTAGETFSSDALTGHGHIAGTPVRCEAPQWAVQWHTGYPPRPVDHHDVPLLCARFGIALPAQFASPGVRPETAW